MQSGKMRWVVLLAAVVLVFGVTVAIGLQVLPSPLTDTDYLVVGSIATFLSLIILFIVLISTSFKSSDVFRKKRPSDEDDTAPEDQSTNT